MVTKENFRIKDVFFTNSDRLGAFWGLAIAPQRKFSHISEWISVAKMDLTKQKTLAK